MSIEDISNEFEELINNGKMKWRFGTVDELPDIGKYVIDMLGGVEWQIGEPRIGNNVVLKLDDEYIQYVDIFDDDKFMFCTDNHHMGVPPRDAITRFLIIKEKDKNKRKQIREFADFLWPKNKDKKL